ncbi:MAG: DUF1329 domain-containing protein [Pseudomonadales bacterium]|nr:DUF1329 domain-containing protein [Pseudomonadales bacterium]
MYNGSLERFNWKLVGKQRCTSPYNTHAPSAFKIPIGDMLGCRFLDPSTSAGEAQGGWSRPSKLACAISTASVATISMRIPDRACE